MRLTRLKIENFKGLKSFEVQLNGAHTSIYGNNATGKTTVADAVFWLLFEKDSLNSAKFEIKPLDKNGNPLGGLDCSVEGIFHGENGNTIALKKQFAEKWVKKRGQAKKQFTGHETKFFLDGVPTKKKDYTDMVKSLCREDVFRLITNPRHFNEVLHWTERRKVLFEVCGDIGDDEVIASDDKFAALPAILGKHDIDDYRKIIKARLSEINKELDRIPIRIDEVAAGVGESRDYDTVRQLLDSIVKTRLEKVRLLEQLINGGEVVEKRKALAEAEAKLIAHDNAVAESARKIGQAHSQLMEKAGITVSQHAAKVQEIEQSLNHNSREIDYIDDRIDKIKKQQDELRAQWHDEDQSMFVMHAQGPCPTCGCTGACKTDEQRAATEQKAREAFNLAKAQVLHDINKKGKAAGAQIEDLQKERAVLDDKIKTDYANLEITKNLHKSARQELVSLEQQTQPPAFENGERTALATTIAQIKADIDALAVDSQTSTQAQQEEINQLDAQIEGLNRELVQIEANSRADDRIAQLKAQEKELGKEYERIESELYLTEEFVRFKVAMMEDRINSKFELARFKLFKENVNGGIEECCDIVSDGVPYWSMNNASRINMGLDICRTLSDYYGITMPVIIDNAEAVTELLDTTAQQIRLVVSKDDPALRIA